MLNKNTLLLIHNEEPSDYKYWDIKQVIKLLNWRKKYGKKLETKSDCPVNSRQFDSVNS